MQRRFASVSKMEFCEPDCIAAVKLFLRRTLVRLVILWSIVHVGLLVAVSNNY